MSWIRCDDCQFMFNTKDGREWRDVAGNITCPDCVEIVDEMKQAWEENPDIRFKVNYEDGDGKT